MLAWLELESQGNAVQLRARWPEWTFLDPPAIHPDVQAQRIAAASAYLRHHHPAPPVHKPELPLDAAPNRPESDPEVVGILNDMRQIAPYVSEADWSFALACLLEHWRSPSRLTRADMVARAVSSELEILQPLADHHRAGLAAWRVLGCLFPTQYFSQGMRTPMVKLRQALYQKNQDTAIFKIINTGLIAIGKTLIKQNVANAKEMVDELRLALLTRPAHSIDVLLGQAAQVTAIGKLSIVNAVRERRGRLPASLPAINQHDLVTQCIEDIYKGSTAPLPDVANFAINWLSEIEEVNADETLRQAVAAVEAGQLYGEPRTTESRAALDKMRAIDAAGDGSLARAQAVWATRTKDGWRVDAPRPESRPDLDPASSWSVDRLLGWIEGPLPQAAKVAKQLNRQAVTQAMRGETTNAQKSSGPISLPATPTNPPDTHEPGATTEADELIVNGLATTAAFFVGCLKDTVVAATRLQIKAALVKPCEQLLKPLEAFTLAPERAKEAEARDLLARAEAALDALSAGVRQQQVGNRRLSGFQQALAGALAGETMVPGKRHGGQVAFPMRPDEWGMVMDSFHRRRMAASHRLQLDDGTPLPLRSDQALALYVTASSRSDFLFDVSVHLWRRRSGCTSGPGLNLNPFAPMNTTDWFDTYIPCLVLHVPQGK